MNKMPTFNDYIRFQECYTLNEGLTQFFQKQGKNLALAATLGASALGSGLHQYAKSSPTSQVQNIESQKSILSIIESFFTQNNIPVSSIQTLEKIQKPGGFEITLSINATLNNPINQEQLGKYLEQSGIEFKKVELAQLESAGNYRIIITLFIRNANENISLANSSH